MSWNGVTPGNWLRPWRIVRQYPGRTIAAILLSISIGGLLFGRYAVSQWSAAQQASSDERPIDARRYLQFCERVWPWSADVQFLQARNARRMGDLGVAERHLNRAMELRGGATEDIQREFLLLRVQAGEVDELATPLFAVVDQGHPDSREILSTVARTFILRLRYKPAYACLSKWIEVEPGNANPYYWRGLVLERLNNEKGASADYHKSLELDPDLIPARLRIAEMLLEDKQAPDALPHLERLMAQAPDNPQIRARMGICLFLQGNATEARQLMESAVVHLPNDPALLVTLANLELQDGRPAEAEGRLRAVLALDRSDTEALFVLVSALQNQGKSEESAATLAEYHQKREIVDSINVFLKDKADDPKTTADEYATVGRKFLLINRDKLGVYWLEKALERDGECQSAHRALVSHYEAKGDEPAAAMHRQRLRGTTTDAAPKAAPPPPPGAKKP